MREAEIYKCECGYMYKESGYCNECGRKLEPLSDEEYKRVFQSKEYIERK